MAVNLNLNLDIETAVTVVPVEVEDCKQAIHPQLYQEALELLVKETLVVPVCIKELLFKEEVEEEPELLVQDHMVVMAKHLL